MAELDSSVTGRARIFGRDPLSKFGPRVYFGELGTESAVFGFEQIDGLFDSKVNSSSS